MRADAGLLARLRRLDAASPPPAFFRVSVDVLDDLLREKGHWREQDESRWAVVVQAIAIALGTSPTSGGLLGNVPFGQALALADVAEMRLLRLLDAEDAQLPDLMRHVIQQMVSKGQVFAITDLADLVLARSAQYREGARRQIARSYYRQHDGN